VASAINENTKLKRHCKELNRSLVGRRGNPIHSLCHSEERLVRRENLILSDSTVPQFINLTNNKR